MGTLQIPHDDLAFPNRKKDLSFDDNVTRISAPNSDPKLYVEPTETKRASKQAPQTFGDKVKSVLRVNVQLMPLKVLMFLMYGGKFLLRECGVYTTDMKSLAKENSSRIVQN